MSAPLIATYVITLNKEKILESEPYNQLIHITENCTFADGVILNEYQANKYQFYSRSGVGITLAHLQLWADLYTKSMKSTKSTKSMKSTKSNYSGQISNYQINNYSLIFEDDFIVNEKKSIIQNIIKNICDSNKFDIYKLHSDDNFGAVSLASYLIKHSSIPKIFKYFKLIIGQIDADIFILHLFKQIEFGLHSYNLFRTDETESNNRSNKDYSIVPYLNLKLSKRADKTFATYLLFNVFRIGNYNLIVYEIVLLMLFTIWLLFFRKNWIFLIVIILLFIL